MTRLPHFKEHFQEYAETLENFGAWLRDSSPDIKGKNVVLRQVAVCVELLDNLVRFFDDKILDDTYDNRFADLFARIDKKSIMYKNTIEFARDFEDDVTDVSPAISAFENLVLTLQAIHYVMLHISSTNR